MRNKIEKYIGKQFNFLHVIGFDEKKSIEKGRTWLICECVCGLVKSVAADCLVRSTKSCGCQRAAHRVTHGYARKGKQNPTYKTWGDMKNRCYSKGNRRYKNYGGRGIKVCDRWKDSFENFLEDMGERPEGMTLDRIDNNGNYTPENCRWATVEEQANNTSRNVFYTYNGETDTLPMLCRKYGVNYNTANTRIRKGLSIEEAMI